MLRKAGFIKKNEQAEPLDEVQGADVPPLEAWDDSVGVTFEEYVKLDEYCMWKCVGRFQTKTFRQKF